VAVLVCDIRGMLELARGRDADALAAFGAGERLAGLLAAPHDLVLAARPWVLQALVRLGETERAEQALAGLGEQDRDHGGIRTATAVLRLAQARPPAPRSGRFLRARRRRSRATPHQSPGSAGGG